MKHKLELIYFKMRALAEAPRLLFHYTEIEYDDVMSWDYYGKDWSEVKPNIPFKQLPMLIVDRKHEICQSMAIMTFIENLAGINITDPILNAKANAIMQSAQELFMPLNPTVNFATGEKFIKKRDDMTPFLLSRFEDLEKVIVDMIDYNGPVIADICVDEKENVFPMIPSGAAHNEMKLKDSDNIATSTKEGKMLV